MYLSDDSSIKLVRVSTVTTTVDDKLEGATMVPPVSPINMLKLMELVNRLGKLKATPVQETEDKPPLEDMEVNQEWLGISEGGHVEEVDQERPKNTEGVQRDEMVVSSTSSYKSLDSIEEEPLRISPYRNKGITQLQKSDSKSTLSVQLIWRQKYLIGEKVKLYYRANL